MEPIKRSYTRQELHELVWSTPMHKLVKQFGLSDRGLAKTCSKHMIPVPPRGYWAKLEAGQSVKKTPLRKVTNTALHRVTVGKSTLSSDARELSDQAKSRKKIEHLVNRKENSPNKLSPVAGYILAPVQQPDLAIRDIARVIRKQRPDKGSGVYGYGVDLHIASVERSIAFLHNLAIRLTAKKLTLVTHDGKLFVKGALDRIAVTFTENTKRNEHVPTKEELAKLERLKKDYPGSMLDMMLPSLKRRAWEQFDITYTGNLRFGCDAWGDGLRQSWSDGKYQRLEGMLDAIVDGVALLIEYENTKREPVAERERRHAEMLRRRELAARRAEREEKRVLLLTQLSKLHQEAADLKRMIESVQDLSGAPAEYIRMIRWAQERLAFIEAKISVDGIVGAARAGNLFPAIDELSDPEG